MPAKHLILDVQVISIALKEVAGTDQCSSFVALGEWMFLSNSGK